MTATRWKHKAQLCFGTDIKPDSFPRGCAGPARPPPQLSHFRPPAFIPLRRGSEKGLVGVGQPAKATQKGCFGCFQTSIPQRAKCIIPDLQTVSEWHNLVHRQGQKRDRWILKPPSPPSSQILALASPEEGKVDPSMTALLSIQPLSFI